MSNTTPRYVVTYLNEDNMRVPINGHQRARFYDTSDEADLALKALKENNQLRVLIDTYGFNGVESFKVIPVTDDNKVPCFNDFDNRRYRAYAKAKNVSVEQARSEDLFLAQAKSLPAEWYFFEWHDRKFFEFIKQKGLASELKNEKEGDRLRSSKEFTEFLERSAVDPHITCPHCNKRIE